MKDVRKDVFVLGSGSWCDKKFFDLKEKDIFSFDKETVFTASCDAYLVENEGTYSVMVVNKNMENFLEEKKKERYDRYFKL